MINKDNLSQIQDELLELYLWVDTVPLTRPKKQIAKDFEDGVLMAEVVHHFLPKQIELQNYREANSYQSKLQNWNNLNTNVFSNLGFQLTQNDIEQIISAQNGAIERILKIVKPKIMNYQDNKTVEPQKSSATNISINNNQSTIQDLEQKIADQQDIVILKIHIVIFFIKFSILFKNTQPQIKLQFLKINLYLQSKILKFRYSYCQSIQIYTFQKQSFFFIMNIIAMLELKINKLQQLVQLKDNKIQTFSSKLQQLGFQF